MKVTAALHHYTAGRLAEALELLDELPGAEPLLAHPSWEATRLERRLAAGTAMTAALRDWLELARDRIRQEMGEDLIAVVPVPLALTTALRLLERRA